MLNVLQQKSNEVKINHVDDNSFSRFGKILEDFQLIHFLIL